MLQKLFRTKTTLKDVEDTKHTQALLEADSWSPPAFNSGQIRIILCQDTGDKAKLTLFDSAYSLVPTTPEERDRINADLSSWSSVNFLSASFLTNQAKTGDTNNKNPNGSHLLSNNTHHPRQTDHFPGENRTNSETTNKSSVRTLPPSLNRSNGLIAQRKAAHNIDLIGEMMFGAVPLSYKGMTTKIHYMKNPNSQILLTKLFSVNTTDLENYLQGRRSSFSSMGSDTSIASSSQGGISNENRNLYPSRPNSIYSESSDEESIRISACSAPASLFHPGPPILGLRPSGITITSPTSSLSTSPRNTFTNRRIRRFSQTSMENGVFNPTPLPGSFSRPEPNLTLKHPSRSIMLHQLQAVAFKLLCHMLNKTPQQMSISGPNSIFSPPGRQRFSLPYLTSLILQNEPLLIEAVFRFKTFMCQLYNTPRIQVSKNRKQRIQKKALAEPLWLNISTFPNQRSVLAKNFFIEMAYLLHNYDDKKSNFFVSTLITAILMHHLSWVPTVAPIADFEERNGKNLAYDPLWAQLGDLYGNIGTPSIMSRTIIVGKDVNTVRRILYVLSYFIRCNEVFENMEQMVPMTGKVDEQLAPEKISSAIGANSTGKMKSPENEVTKTIPIPIPNSSIKFTKNGVTNDVEDLEASFGENKVSLPNTRILKPSSTNINISSPQKSSTTITKEQSTSQTNNSEGLQLGEACREITLNSNHMVSNELKGPKRQCKEEKVETRRTSAILGSPVDICLDQFMDVPMPSSHIPTTIPDPSISTNSSIIENPIGSLYRADQLFVKSYGRSLMAGYCQSYMSDFVLMGLPQYNFQDILEADLKESVQQFSTPELVSSSQCIIGDLNNLNCTVLGYEADVLHPVVVPSVSIASVTAQSNQIRDGSMFLHRSQMSEYVYTLLHECNNLYATMGMPAESCLDYLEDQLRILYLKTLMYKRLVNVITQTPTTPQLYKEPSAKELAPLDLCSMLGLQMSDMALLRAISSTF
ncbi:hypothetical protein G9A89_019912 [Geosiphon pyriformis]|nr:hypothetical protein G9A89_019912 [Geosiphon pyriformis]